MFDYGFFSFLEEYDKHVVIFARCDDYEKIGYKCRVRFGMEEAIFN